MKTVIGFAFAAAALGLIGSANAADLPVKAPIYKAPPPVALYNWSGFYIGLHAGAAWSSGDAEWDPLPSPAAFGSNTITQNLSDTSFVGGVHLGYNFMLAPNWLLGIEGDWSWTNNDASWTTPWTFFGTSTPVPGASTTMSRKIDWLSTVRGRFGYTVTPQALLYVTGGFAFGEVKYDATAFNGTTYTATFSDSTVKTGWTVGGGLEWALTRNWLLRGEYLFYRLGSESGTGNSAAFPAFPSGFNWNAIDIHVARVGVSYKF